MLKDNAAAAVLSTTHYTDIHGLIWFWVGTVKIYYCLFLYRNSSEMIARWRYVIIPTRCLLAYLPGRSILKRLWAGAFIYVHGDRVTLIGTISTNSPPLLCRMCIWIARDLIINSISEGNWKLTATFFDYLRLFTSNAKF